ncbi:hypothetical protein WJX73_003352 [Symbiochloris irregularis]|uniref:NADH:ubiquinone reductase (non-electrogenic) n=1 Tax=Symbiochloris irregularis TaxID=706552 RepID=A0AAW1PVU6_9CHLO
MQQTRCFFPNRHSLVPPRPPPRVNQQRPSAVLSPEKPREATQEKPSTASPPQRESSSTRPTDKPRVVVLGSGWGAASFVKSLSKRASQQMDLILVSDRTYFLYTPLLPAAATGTVEERSIVEPVRRIMAGKGRYYEAEATAIDPKNKTITAHFPEDAEKNPRDVPIESNLRSFQIPYDILVLGVGSVNNTFGIEGVKEHTSFFKSADDAQFLRRQVSACFERASLPDTPPEERRQLLSFVIVGGGPTGVEVAAELHDMVQDDLRKIYGDFVNEVRIRVIELQDHVLSTYDRAISIYTANVFKRSGIELVLNSRVQSVAKNKVSVVGPNKEVTDIPFGACVWATGVAMSPLTKQLQGKLPGNLQHHFRSIVTDECLQVKGSEGSIYAIGDAATIEQERAMVHAQRLFEQADANRDGVLCVTELRDVLRTASATYSHLQEHALFLDSQFGGEKRWGGMVKQALEKARVARVKPNGAAPAVTTLKGMDQDTELTKEQFEALLGKIDDGLRALPATAQVAAQQGKYLAKLLTAGKVKPGASPLGQVEPFKYGHKGSLAYVGRDKAVMDVPGIQPLTGFAAGLLWKGYETYSQISIRNMLLVAGDWVRTKLFGRDISRM